jgi:hypothetical protein
MHHIWSMMNSLNVLMFMLKSNVFVPPMSEVFFTNINDFLSMKSNWTDNAVDEIETYFNGVKASQEAGVIKNLGIYLLLGVLIILLIASTLLLMLLAKKFPPVQRLVTALKNSLFFNSLLRFSLQSYLKICDVAFLSISSQESKSQLI